MTNITNDIRYIGVNDHEIDLFEGMYIVPNGMAYNSYVILDEKVAVMDTADRNFVSEWLANLSGALEGRRPDFLVVHHMEPDHSAGIVAFAEEYPEEYERRGKDIFAFKMRGAESFYDMQYRVKAALRNILRNDDAKDIIIVAHSGVIRALENNILGKQVDDAWEPVPKGGLKMLEPFPEQKSEKVHGDRPMNMNDMTMEAVYEMYE